MKATLTAEPLKQAWIETMGKQLLLSAIFLAVSGSAFAAHDFSGAFRRLDIPQPHEVALDPPQTVHTFPALDTNNTFTGPNAFTNSVAVGNANAVIAAGALNSYTEGCSLQSLGFNTLLNLNQCVAGGGAVPSLPLYVQANPSGSQTGNTQGGNWSAFSTIKAQNLTGLPTGGAGSFAQGFEAEAFYTGTISPGGTQFTLKGVGGQVYIDNSTTATTASVPIGYSGWVGAPFLAYGGCSSCGTGNFSRAVSLHVEQPTASDSKGNPVGTASRAAVELISNFTNDPVAMDWSKTGVVQWELAATANASAQPFDFALSNLNIGGGGFRFQNSSNGNVYIRAIGTGQVIFQGNPTFAGEGPTTNGTAGAAFLPGGASGSVCTPSTSGVINFCNNTAAYARNAANSVDLQLFNTDTRNNTNLVTHGTGTSLRIVNGASTPLFGFADDGGSNGHFSIASLLMSNVAPTISSGFGTSPSIIASNGTAAFEVNVGTGGTATSGVIALPTAAHGWACGVGDIGTGTSTRETAFTTTSVTVTGSAAWSTGSNLTLTCNAF